MARHAVAAAALACRCALALMLVGVLPAVAFAQASITGVIRDTSGAVLPGVTVEASSPILIEKVRSVASDGGGQYRIVDLRPGVYAVTFTLPGFNTLRREGIELTGNFTATINAELRVGALEETVTVTGEAPAVDVQGVTRQRALSADVIDAVPTGRNFSNLGSLIPGVSATCLITCSAGDRDVGGSAGDSRSMLVVHGSRFRDQRMAINGMTFAGSTGGLYMTGPNVEAVQEIQIETSGIDASVATGGVRVNVVPKDGGNTFSGSLFFSGTNEDLQGDNITQELRDRGLKGRPGVKKLYDFAAAFGGPIKKDKLWFFTSMRLMNNENYVANKFANLYENDRTKWTYEPDLSKPTTADSPLHPRGARLTWQATPRIKIAGSLDLSDRCDCPNVASGSNSREAEINFYFRPDNIAMLSLTSPVTNRLLLEATGAVLVLGWGGRPSEFLADRSLIQVTEQSPPASWGAVRTYRGHNTETWTHYPARNLAFVATYVTGAHALKAGTNFNWTFAKNNNWMPRPITSYTFNKGVPVGFLVNSDPRFQVTRQKGELGLFVQDRWTFQRLTLSGGLRYDYMNRYSPEQSIGPTPLLPNRNVTFPETSITRHHDLSPRLGAAYDLFGTGKTAVKVTLNRYVTDESLGSGTNVLNNSPANFFQYTAFRAWTDGNGNYIPDCDLSSPARQDNLASGGDLCGAFVGPSANFGLPTGGTVADDEVNFGRGARGYNWEFSASVQQELVPGRVAVDVGYFRRTYGNFLATDNLTLAAADYSKFSVVVPTDSRLPLSGQTINGFLNVNPNVAALPSNNHVRLANEHYGDQFENWQGVDVNLSARFRGGTLVQGGFSTGRHVQDNCEILANVPETGVTSQFGTSSALLAIGGPLANPFCHQETPFLTQVKLLGSYTIPRVDVQLSGTFQSLPGVQIEATNVYPNAVVKPSLGRDLSGNAPNVTVNIVAPGSLYGDRVNQTDFRVGKIFRFAGNRRATASVDLFNLFNSSAVLNESTVYSQFRTPTRVISARLVKFSASLNF